MLRERRLQLGLSQETVADRAQIHRTPSAMIERYAESDDAPQ
jgi:transcriptional regulator with XRE-family HTH domain